MENLPFSTKCNDGNLSQLGVHYSAYNPKRTTVEQFPPREKLYARQHIHSHQCHDRSLPRAGSYLSYIFHAAFAARDAALEEKLKSVSPRISGQTTMWRAGVGFHVSHALGIIFFGLVYGYLALAERDFLIRAPFLVVLGALVLLGYVVLAKLFWFYLPLVGVALALACYVAGVAVAYA
jgi:hypothetical protein